MVPGHLDRGHWHENPARRAGKVGIKPVVLMVLETVLLAAMVLDRTQYWVWPDAECEIVVTNVK